MSNGIGDDSNQLWRVVRRANGTAIGIQVQEQSEWQAWPVDDPDGWDGFYNIRGNVGTMDMSAVMDYVVVDFTANTPSWSAGPMQNHNPDEQMMFRTADIKGGLYV